jgi:hypothetical protein
MTGSLAVDTLRVSTFKEALSGTCVPHDLIGQAGWIEKDDAVSLRPYDAVIAELSQHANDDLTHGASGICQALLRDPYREFSVRIAGVVVR